MFNIKNNLSIEENYQQGLLPQRNSKDSFYQDENSSSRSRLENLIFSSENRRIFKKTDSFSFKRIKLSEFFYNSQIQKQIFQWVRGLNWDFPTSSIKTVFTNHIFNYLYIWYDIDQQVCAYSLCYFEDKFSHIAYVFYDPKYAHQDLPIRLALQVVKDSFDQGLEYCYLGRFNLETKLGYYKRSFPGFQYFTQGAWITYNQ